MGCCFTDRKRGSLDNDGPLPTQEGFGEEEDEEKDDLLETDDKLEKELKGYRDEYDEGVASNNIDQRIQADKKGPIGQVKIEDNEKGSHFRKNSNVILDTSLRSASRKRQQSITDIPAENKETALNRSRDSKKNLNISFNEANKSNSQTKIEIKSAYNGHHMESLFNNSRGNEDNELIVAADKRFKKRRSGLSNKSNDTASFIEILDANDKDAYFQFENNMPDTQKFSLNISTMTGISRKHDESYSFLENSIENIVQMKHSSNQSTYFSINSTSIIGNNYYTEERPAHILQEPHDIANLFCRNFIFFYFEFHYFSLWGKEYLSAIYPELNIIMVIEINDSKVTQEKIPLIKSKKKDKVKEVRYYPELKKQDLNSKVYRIIQAFDVNHSNRNSFPFKINISFYTFTNHKMLMICSDEIFLRATREGEMQKYTMLRNTFAKHYHKKLGNVLFNFAYKSDDLSPSELEFEKQKMLKNFFELKDFSKFEENSELNFNYYGIENLTFRENGGGENGSNSDNTYKNYISLKDLETESGDDIKNENNLEKLLEMLMTEKKKFEFYQILKRLNDFICTNEFREAKLIKFKEILTSRLEESSEKLETTDKILVPFIFGTLKNAFFKTQNQNGGGSRYKKRNPAKNVVDEKTKAKTLDIEAMHVKNVELMTSCLDFAFSFLRNDIHEDVCLSALNFIHRYLEENIPIIVNSKNIPTQDYFLQYIVDRKYYIKFFETILRYYEYNACVQPIIIIFRKILKTYKEKAPELLQLFANEKFKEIFRKLSKTHDCNGLVMTNIFHLLQHLAVSMEPNYIQSIIPLERLKEVFSIFKNYGYEQFHESAVNLIKVMLLRRISKGGELNTKQTFNTSVVLNVTHEEHSEIVQIFATALTLMNRKLTKMDNSELREWMNTLLSHVNVISNVLQCALTPNMELSIQYVVEKKIFEMLIDIFILLRDRSIIKFIETLYKNNFETVMQMKTTLLRTLYHLIDLFVSLNVHACNMKPSLVDKISRLIETLRDNDKIYNPDEITKSLSRDRMLNDEATKSIKKIEYYYSKFNLKCKEFYSDPTEVVERKRSFKQK